MTKSLGQFINNKWIKGDGVEMGSVNPATEKKIWTGYEASMQEIIYAMKAAREAQQAWQKRTFEQRRFECEKFKMVIEKNKDALAKVISEETGKPLWESESEVSGMSKKIAVSVQAYLDRCKMQIYPIHEKVIKTQFKPLGVVGVLGPFNFPGHLPLGQIIPALLAGNTVVFKPSEYTPKVGELLMSLWELSDPPAGVFNMVQGGAEVGETIAMHPDLNGLFFVGGYHTGRRLAALYADYPDRCLALELGGNNPMIVSTVDDVQKAALQIVMSAYITTGQRCSCLRRLIIIENKQTKDLIDAIQNILKTIKIADFTEKPDPFCGPLISQKAKDHILEIQNQWIQLGAIPMNKIKSIHKKGYFVSPGLIDVTQILNTIEDEEQFGPLCQLIRVRSLNEAIKTANNTKFGLSSSILTNKEDEYNQCFEQIKAGLINWNCPTTGASPFAPFGGVKGSGNHRPSGYFTSDYCSYPVASSTQNNLELPTIPPGLTP